MLHPSIVSPCFPASPFVNANCIKLANHEALEWVSILWMRSCWINWIPETVTSMSPAVGWSPMNRHGPHGFQKRANVSHSLGCTMCLGYKKYPPGNQHIPSQGTSEDYFPLPVLVVYVSSLEGRRLWDALHLFFGPATSSLKHCLFQIISSSPICRSYSYRKDWLMWSASTPIKFRIRKAFFDIPCQQYKYDLLIGSSWCSLILYAGYHTNLEDLIAQQAWYCTSLFIAIY